MTRIGLVSDTHIPVDAKVLPGQIKEIFHDVDLILHAGDIYITSVLDELERIAPVLAAQGDDDDYDITSDRRVKQKQTLTVEGTTITLTHCEPGLGPWSVFPNLKENLEEETSFHYNNMAGIMVCGHSHMPKVQNRGGFLLINPGSPTFPYYVHRLGTVALLTINSGEAEVRMVQLQ
jgi:putative phosphoesterase